MPSVPIEFEFDPLNLIPGFGGFAIAESFFTLGAARADTLRSEFLLAEAEKVTKQKRAAFDFQQGQRLARSIQEDKTNMSFLAKLAARFAPALKSTLALGRKAAPIVGAGAAFGAGDVAVQAALAPTAVTVPPAAAGQAFALAPGGIQVAQQITTQRGRMVTVTFRVLPDGTKIPMKVVPGGVAIFQRDITAAKRVKRVLMKTASSVGLKTVSAGRRARKGKK